ncbi:MAG: hypothetical protein AAFP86_19485 [Planctomycetota bacterium]
MLDTRSSWIGRHEVVEVRFDPGRIGYERLLDVAIAHGCADRAWATSAAQLSQAEDRLGADAERLEGEPRIAKASDQLYYLRSSTLRYVPLTPLQARRVNGALFTTALAAAAEDAEVVEAAEFMSPRQRALDARIHEALRRDRSALDGLVRPEGRVGLGAYAAELEARLSAAGV